MVAVVVGVNGDASLDSCGEFLASVGATLYAAAQLRELPDHVPVLELAQHADALQRAVPARAVRVSPCWLEAAVRCGRWVDPANTALYRPLRGRDLERLLQQVLATHDAIRDANLGYGDNFSLAKG